MGRQGKGQGKESGHGYVGSPVFLGKGLGWWGGVVPPAVPPIVPPFPPPPYPASGMVYPPPPAYQGMPPQRHLQQRPQDGGTAWGAQEGKGEEHRRAWERLGEVERSLREREARVKGEAGGADEGRTEGTDRPQGGEAQTVEELQRAWADHWRRPEGVERAEREGGQQEEGRGREGTPLVPFRQRAIPPEQEGEMQERAWRRTRGEAARLAEKGEGGGGTGAQGAGGGGSGGPGGSPGPPGSGRGHPLHGCGRAVAVSEKGQGGGRGDGAGKGEAAQGGGARGRGGGGGAAAGQPQPRADANGLGLGVAAAAAACAAAGAEATRDGRGVDGAGSGGAGPLREVGGEDDEKAGEGGGPPLQRPGWQDREAQGKGASDG